MGGEKRGRSGVSGDGLGLEDGRGKGWYPWRQIFAYMLEERERGENDNIMSLSFLLLPPLPVAGKGWEMGCLGICKNTYE
jgi:hypothetical protein